MSARKLGAPNVERAPHLHDPVFQLVGRVSVVCSERFDAPLWQATRAAGTAGSARL